jgi:DNA polymerase-3 subunit epsilon
MRWLRDLLGSGESAQGRAERAAAQRWVVLDVETSGLDQRSDTLLAIGAVAVRSGRVCVDDSFELVVRPPSTSERSNILIHGIGQRAQEEGMDPREACRQFLDWAGPAPLVGYHVSFDRAFLARAVSSWLGLKLTADWLDLAGLAPALNPGVKAKALDEWLEHFRITVGQRHHASADAFATATLFLRLLAQVRPSERDVASLQKLSLAQRWAGGG